MLPSLRAWLVCGLVVGAAVTAGIVLPSERPAAQPAPVGGGGGIAGICAAGAENCEDESTGSITVKLESP